jgi:hypothetical protein
MAPMAVLAAASGGLSAAGSLYEGSAQRAASEYNARLSRMSAVQIRQQTAYEAKQASIYARKTIGDMRANYAASGVRMEGSPLDVLEESIRAAQTDISNIKNQGEMNARMKEFEAKLYKFQGKSAQISGYFSAASALASGGMKAYDYNSSLGKT